MENKRYRSTFYFNGKQYEAASSISQSDADKKAAIKQHKLESGEVGISSNMTVQQWANEWLKAYKSTRVGEKQYKAYQTIINNDIVPVIGNKPIKSIKSVDLQKIVNSKADKSRSSIDKLRLTIKGIFTKAYDTDLIPKNPSKNIEYPVKITGTHRSITDTERKAILEVANKHRAGLWVKTLLYCGLRPGETRALQWRHIDFDNKLIHVESAMKAGTNEVGAPKSAAGVRDVPIPDKLFVDLEREYTNQQSQPFMPVFARETRGLHHTESSIRLLWLSFKRELDIHMGAQLYRNQVMIHAVADELTPYCLRHTYCTDLQDAGVPINIARYLMGHSDISMTAKIYTHTTDKAIQTAAELINKHA